MTKACGALETSRKGSLPSSTATPAPPNAGAWDEGAWIAATLPAYLTGAGS